jgi:hypothetical protein
LLKLSHLRGKLLLTDSIGLVTLGKKPLLSLETRNLRRDAKGSLHWQAR